MSRAPRASGYLEVEVEEEADDDVHERWEGGVEQAGVRRDEPDEVGEHPMSGPVSQPGGFSRPNLEGGLVRLGLQFVLADASYKVNARPKPKARSREDYARRL